MRLLALPLILLAGLTLTGPAAAQWDPDNAQWGKEDPSDIRVMTWNVEDALCSSQPQNAGTNSWNAIVAVIASFKPDVLLLQETADNSGNGTGSGLDSVATLTTVLEEMMHGGPGVGAYVQLYAPAYDLPHIFVSAATDGFNRNVIMSKYPFGDINGDGISQLSTFPLMITDEWYTTIHNPIRGFQIAEIDLPDGSYAGDLVVANSHLKAFGGAQDQADRENTARRASYYMQYFYHGNGTGVSDPNGKITGGNATSVLDTNTPIIWGGDWNEDESTNGRKGPAEWFVRAEVTGTPDGVDHDGTDAMYDDARQVFNESNGDTRGGSKLDYLAWTDSVATLRRAFIYNSSPASGNQPPEIVAAYPSTFLQNSVTSVAADHLPVLADYVLPGASASPPGAFNLTTPADLADTVDPAPSLVWTAASDANGYDVTIATDAALSAVVHSASGVATTFYNVPDGVLAKCGSYYWGLTATNAGGDTESTPTAFRFDTVLIADINSTGTTNGMPDGTTNLSDLQFFLTTYQNDLGASPGSVADVNTTGTTNGVPDGTVNLSDLQFFLTAWANLGCP